MGKAKRYGYIFTWYVGDHLLFHIHVYRDGKLICKWALFEQIELSGKSSPRIRKAIKELSREGAFRRLRELKDED